MAIEKLTKDLNIIQKLDDEPNDVGGLTSAELKAEFDKAGNEIKKYMNDTVVPAINSVQTQADASTADQHTHSNKALLDTYDQANADIKDAIAKEHTHSNKAVLDAITADQQTVLAGIKGVTQTLGNATDKVPSEAAVAAAMSANGNIPAGGTTGQVLAKASENALDVEWKSLEAKDVANVGIVNPNLLDNGYFVNPVNQRGQTEYAVNGYTIDRWSSNYANLKVELVNGGIKVTNKGTAACAFRQPLENKPVLSVYTASVLCEAVTGTVYLQNFYADGTTSSALKLTDGLVCGTEGKSTGFDRFSFYFTAGASVILKAAKLELGSQQTLAHEENGEWVLNEIPNYNEELLKCIQSTADSTDTYANRKLLTEDGFASALNGIKPSGTYIGTGTKIYSINIGGTGKFLLLKYDDKDAYDVDVLLVMENVAFEFRPTSDDAIDYRGNITFKDGILSCTGGDASNAAYYYNGEGYSYTYQVL